jgi:RNA polymerase sigma-70 factor (ECF subfamily)
MFVICQRYTQNRQDAEDVLQEGFIKSFQHLKQYRFDGSFEGWMRKIMINCALQKYRSQTHLHIISNGDGDSQEHTHFFDEDITARIATKELICLVQQLPASYRMVFNLYVFEGMKHKEIAAMLSISEGTSKSNLFDARLLLQKAVKKSMQVARSSAR